MVHKLCGLGFSLRRLRRGRELLRLRENAVANGSSDFADAGTDSADEYADEYTDEESNERADQRLLLVH